MKRSQAARVAVALGFITVLFAPFGKAAKSADAESGAQPSVSRSHVTIDPLTITTVPWWASSRYELRRQSESTLTCENSQEVVSVPPSAPATSDDVAVTSSVPGRATTKVTVTRC
jgi:hypothetical protein